MTTISNKISDIPILQAGLKDLFQLSRLERQCFSHNDTWPLFELMNVLISPRIVRLKVEVDGEMIAFLCGERKSSQSLGWITTICVAPPWRDMGLGGRLLAAGEQALDTGKIRLTVRASNQTALRLYEKSDYYEIGREKEYYHGGEDGIVMEKTRPVSSTPTQFGT